MLRIALFAVAASFLSAGPPAVAAAYESATECRHLAGHRVCVVVEATATRVPTRLCEGEQPPGKYCFRKVEMGRAYSDGPVAGAADFFGQQAPRRCGWEVTEALPSGGACSVPDLTVFEFDTPRADCFETWGTARGFLGADTRVLMSTFAAVVSPDCPAPS